MATNLALYDYEDEDYIDMEISSSPKSRDFEFQLSFISNKLEATADELFYEGMLLPLHHRAGATAAGGSHYYYSVPCTNTTNTPLDSCHISPSNSCRVSCELNPDDHIFEWSTELSSFINNHPTKKPWSKKLKLIKHSVQMLKASRTYLKSLFCKSVWNQEADQNKKKHSSMMKNIGEDNRLRRSFSGAINRDSQAKCCSSNSSSGASSSSSSFSVNSSGFNELNFLRSRSEAEIEVSVDAAIAHCKNSQRSFCSRTLTRSPERRKKEEEEEFDERVKA